MNTELNFEEMKVNELKQYCKENGIKCISGLKKINIIDKIKKHNMKETVLVNSSTSNIKFIDLFCGNWWISFSVEKIRRSMCISV